jgi:hypothetical protein
MRDHGRRVRAGTHAQQVRDQISDALKDSHQVRLDFADVESVGATFLDSTLGILVARDGVDVLRSIVFVHCSTRVEASIARCHGSANASTLPSAARSPEPAGLAATSGHCGG